jgi:hypothetical protein
MENRNLSPEALATAVGVLCLGGQQQEAGMVSCNKCSTSSISTVLVWVAIHITFYGFNFHDCHLFVEAR